MRNTRSNTRLRVFGTIALGVAALALVLSTVFSSTDAAATSSEVDSNPQPAEQAIQLDMQADTVVVTISDGSIEVPESVAAGAATLEVTNSGQQAHGFAIGSDTSASAEVASLEGELTAGQSETLTAELEPGTYTAYCPVEGHQESAEFTVQ